MNSSVDDSEHHNEGCVYKLLLRCFQFFISVIFFLWAACLLLFDMAISFCLVNFILLKSTTVKSDGFSHSSIHFTVCFIYMYI